MIRFAFDVYDEDNSKELSWDEAYKMLIESYGGEKHMTVSTRKAVRKLQEEYENALLDAFLDGEENVVMGMTRPKFIDFVIANMAVFYPVLLLQREIKSKVIGEDFWRNKNEELDWLHGNTDRKIKFSYGLFFSFVCVCVRDAIYSHSQQILAKCLERSETSCRGWTYRGGTSST